MIITAKDEQIEYELFQDDMCVAGTSGPGAVSEIQHYAQVYEQDGPVEIFQVVRRSIYKTEEKNESTS